MYPHTCNHLELCTTKNLLQLGNKLNCLQMSCDVLPTRQSLEALWQLDGVRTDGQQCEK